jgi:hypothetical protein
MDIVTRIEKVIGVIQRSFAPYTCVAESWDYKNKIRYAVFDGEETLYEFKRLTPEIFTENSSLKVHLEDTRKALKDKGLTLSEWVMPEIEGEYSEG